MNSEEELEQLRKALEEEQEKNKQLQAKLDRIYENKYFKATKPLRVLAYKIAFFFRRIKNLGNLKGVIKKALQKGREKRALVKHGTKSFPNAEEGLRQRNEKFENPVKISILVPLWNNKKKFQIEMLECVLNQTYENWELCLADGSDEEHSYIGEICKEYVQKSNGRIVYKKLDKNYGIAGNTNECLKMATGDYIGLFDQDDLLHPSALYKYVKVINEQKADYLYCDEITFTGNSIDNMIVHHFKPSFSEDNLRANNYICHFSVFKKELLDGDELFRSGFDGSQDHDMIFRLTSRAKKIVHVSEVLYYWRSHATSAASGIQAKPYAIEAAKGAIADHLKRLGYKNFEIESTVACETIFDVKYEIADRENKKVSIIIENKAGKAEACANSIREKATYDNYEIIIEKGEDSYSKLRNEAAKKATGQYLLFVDENTKVEAPDFIERLLMHAQRNEVAAVGGRLFYKNGDVYQSGVVLKLGKNRIAGYAHQGLNHDNVGYMGRLWYAQETMAVAGSLLMLKKDLFCEAGGFDESLKGELSSVDLCLKLFEKGYFNIQAPMAMLEYHGNKTRRTDVGALDKKYYSMDSKYFKEKWKAVLEKGDIYFNSNFSLDYSYFCIK